MSAPAPALPPFGTIIDVRFIYGPLLLGAFFNMILFGILVAQMLTYFQSSQKDPLYMRIFVYGVFFVECANTALDIQIMFQLLVLQYDKLPTVFMTIPICVILVAFPCQLFFIWRIYTFTQSKILSGFIVVLALTTLGVGMWAVYHLISAGAWARVPLAHQAAETWLFFSAATDLVIAFCLAWALKGKKTGMKATDTVVDRIIRLTIQTGVVTALFNVLDVVSFLTIKNATFNFMFNIPLSKLYSNCLMSALNARSGYNKKLNGLSTGNTTMNAPVFQTNPALSVSQQDSFSYAPKGARDEEYYTGDGIRMTTYTTDDRL
ncbi:hypothetical protein B0H11DRAFT_278862 [Mycena galericulata]|nr:hypothetical protein B0H11DRAFT_278862 [Mycena galericulata]